MMVFILDFVFNNMGRGIDVIIFARKMNVDNNYKGIF